LGGGGGGGGGRREASETQLELGENHCWSAIKNGTKSASNYQGGSLGYIIMVLKYQGTNLDT